MSSRLQTQVKTAPKLSLTPARTDHMQPHAEYRKELQILEGLSTNPQEPFTVPPIKKVLRPGSQSIGTAVTASFEPRFGHNFGRVRVHTALPEITQTKLRASQSEDEQEEEATQPAQQVLETPEPAAQEGTEPTDLAPGATGPAVNEIQTPARAEPTTGTAVTDDTRSPGLLVEDSVDELGPGQMKKSEFLDELHTVVCSAAEAALASTGRSAQGCPYLDYWFDLYRTKDSAHIERAIRRYAPEASGVATARDYIPLITERILRAISVWANTGEITGVPEGVPTNLNDMGTVGKSGGTPGNSGSTVSKDHDSSTWDAENSLTIRSQLGSGRPLDNGVKSRMESAFRHDFSHVRIHTDIKAAELSNRFSARAFTVGKDVAFGAGEYQPGTPVGDAIIAHELAHVMQQGDADSAAEAKQRSNSQYNALEEDADMSTLSVLVSLHGKAKSALSNIARNTMPRLKSGLGLQRCKGDAGTPAQQKTPPTTQPTTAPPLPAITGVLTPGDNFSGRSTTNFGIGEVINLSFTATPASTAAAVGGLRWSIDSGGGTLTGGADGLGVYTAGSTAGSVRLVLKVDSGPNAGTVVATNNLTIVAPSGAVMEQAPSTNIMHVHGKASVGFKGHIFLRPVDVSFNRIQFREGTVTATATGFFAADAGQVHALGTWVPVGSGNSTKGSRVDGTDTVSTGPHNGPYSNGTFLWPIPWNQRIGTGTETNITTANHQETVDATGKATIQKAGAGPFSKNLNDPTSSF